MAGASIQHLEQSSLSVRWPSHTLFAGAKGPSLSHRAAVFPNCTATEKPGPLAQAGIPSA